MCKVVCNKMKTLIFFLLSITVAFVEAPLPFYTPATNYKFQSLTRDGLISAYFKQAYANKEILLFLSTIHGVVLSLAHLKRILRRLGLKRRRQLDNDCLQRTINEIRIELKESGQCLGYKSMWRRLKLKDILVPRNVVRVALTLLDPEGVNLRKRKRLRRRQYVNPGPNFVWHIDGCDKLKPYGFAIHGAIDGFSRKILWLEVGPTNNNPLVIAKYYLDAVLQLRTVPSVLRCDRGSENVHLARIQPFLRQSHEDCFCGDESFMYGRSTGNQRIESWWCILRKQGMNFWINLFKDMISLGLLDTGNILHIHSMRFCFMHLISSDLAQIATEWNHHKIESRKNDEGPSGKPDVMYYAPQKYDTVSYGFLYNNDDVVQTLGAIESDCEYPEDYNQTFLTLINELFPEWSDPKNVDQALDMYGNLLAAISNFE